MKRRMIWILLAGVLVGLTLSGLYKHFVTDQIMDRGGMENPDVAFPLDGDRTYVDNAVLWSVLAGTWASADGRWQASIRDLVQFRRRRAEHNRHPLQLGQQCPSGLRQPNALVRSVKNRNPKFLLQRLNMAAQGGLGQIEVCGRLGKILLPRRFQHTFQLHYRHKLRLHA